MATSTNIVFPNIINVVLNDFLSNFMTLTTVSPAAATGTFTFRKTNSSGTQLEPTSKYDAVGPYTIFCSFTATGSYASSTATITLSVQDKDLFNNYFNIPVTDPNNVLVNGDFNYFPSSIGTNASAVFESGATTNTVPGWYFSNYYINGTSQWGNWYGPYTSVIYNNVDLGLGGGVNGFRYPFGNVCLQLYTSLYQYFYCVAGTYTLKLYVATPAEGDNSQFMINIDKNRILNVNGTSTFGTGALQIGVWQQVSVTFTVATTGMHSIVLQFTAAKIFYIGNVSITPAATNPIYLRFSKINSLIANGTFETPVASTNSKSITPITNWTVTGNAWTLNNYSTDLKIPIPYPSGNQCIALETTARISQTFTATASSSNFLSFYACSSLNDGSMNSLKVTINNSTLICDISNFAFRSGGWTKQIYSGITTISGENILTIQGGSTIAGYISAIDNVIFGQVAKETVNVQFGPLTNYQYLPLQNETMTSNTYTAIANGSLIGKYECTASTNGVFPASDIYYLFDSNPSTFYHSAFKNGGVYFSDPYLQNGTYCGANNASGILTYFWTTNVVDVGTVSGEWVQIKLPSPIKLTGYSLTARQNLPNRFPANYYVLGSNDGTTWYSIKSITNSQLTNAQVPAWPNSQYVDVSNNTQMYMFYRLVCTKLVSDGWILNFSQFALFGDNSKNYYGTPLGANLNAYSSVVSGTSLYYLDQGYTDRVYPNTLLPVGNYTLYSVFSPSDTVDYLTSYGSTTLSVVPAETDVFNSYFNIPVTDRNNVLVNGDFNYFPSTITTSAIFESGATSGTVPGWYFSNYYLNANGITGYSGGPYSSIIYNNVDLGLGGGANGFRYPFGNVCLNLKTSVYQFFYCVAGTYTLKLYVAIPTTQSISSAGVFIDKNFILLINFVTSGSLVGTGMLQAGWQQVVTTFTVATTGMHSLLLQYTAGQTFYIGNVSITPAATNPIYLQISKINSLIANGTFDTPVASTNSKTNLAITNWTVTANTGNAWTLNNYSTDLKIPIPYPSGNQCVALESTAKISRTFTSSASTSNVLSFYVCGGLNDGSMNSLKVTINNSTLICDISNFGFRTGGWSKQIYSGITTISGENILSFEGGSQIAGYITAIDNVIFGQVTKEARPITFVSPTNYQFLPFRNETMTSNTYNATQHGSLNGTYECTASSNRTVSGYDIYQLFTNDPTKIYISSDTYGGTPLYYRLPYPGDGTYIGATDSNNNVAYFFKTSVVNVGTISGEWVQIKLPSPIRLTRYGLMGRNGYPQRFPLNYYVLGSNDGSTWYSIKSVTNSPIPTWPNTQYVDVPENTLAYSFYRLVATKLGTDGLVLNFSKFYLFGDNSKTYYGTPLGSRLTATTDISGTFAYYTDASYNNRIYPDSTLPASNYTLYSVFTPADTIDYIPSYANTPLSIIASNPQIVFPNVINVVLGTTLEDFISRVTISPVVAGTFIFQKNNSSGPIITSSSVYDAVGAYTIVCTFVPTNQVTYNTSSTTITLSVQDKDLFNNYFNIPVTDGSNILVNGNFDYIPSSIPDNSSNQYLSGTSAGSLPGWYSTSWGSPTQYWPGYNITIYNNINLGTGIAFPYPFGTKCIGLTGWLWQYFYCVAGTYTLKFYAAVKTLIGSAGYAGINIDNTRVMNLNQSKTENSLGSDQIPVAWKQISINFTIATTGMHSLWMAWTGGGTGFYLGNFSITPNNNFTYLRPSKINSLIANGMFETEIKTANSKSLTPITNWTVTGNAWVLNNYSTELKIPIPYPSRNQCVAIESTAKISQTFTSTASSSNFLSFYVCGSTDDGSMNNIKVTVNSTVICDISYYSFRPGGWTKQIFSGISTISGENILTIEGGAPPSTGYISAIDNVVFGQVTKETRPITFTPQTNKGGTPLAANLTATTDISGTFAYYRDASYNIPVTAATTLAVGNYTLYTVFTPADTVDYNVAYANTSLAVIVQVIFPNVIYVVFGDTLEGFMNATTVSSGVPGTFTFRKTNISGAVLTANNTYDAVGTYTIFCSFVPTNTAAYNSCNATITLNVADKDSFNNYFNIPVTDPNNVLVNGDFNYIPSIAEGTMVSAPTNVPGWTFYKTTNWNIFLVNNMDVSAGITYQSPFASKTKKMIYFTGGYLFQWFYAVAGTYQFSAYYAAPSVSTNYIYFHIDSFQSNPNLRSSTLYPNLQNWQLYTTNVTISTTGMHRFMMTVNGSSQFYAANFSLTPINNPIYLRFSKISSKIFNGAFETDVQTANSMTLAPLTNWTTVTGNIWVLNNYAPYLSTLPYPYPSGNQCIVVGGLGKITQTFTHVASSVNYLSFYMCSINDLSLNGIRVTLNSTTILETSSNIFIPSASSLNSGSWQKMLFSGITTISGENTLIIEGLNNGNFLTAIDNVIFGQVTKEARPITFGATAQTIYYGTPIAARLNASTDISGTFAYYLDAVSTNQVYGDSTLPVGNYTLYAVFSPTDTIDYLPSSANVSFTVITPNPKIVFPNVINVVLNDKLADFMSRVTVSPANVSGTFTFRNASGSIITSDSSYNTVGPYTISCTFVPNVIDTKFYVVWHSNGSYNVQSFTTLAEATTSYNSIANSLSRALFNPSQNVVQSWYFNESWQQGILTHYLSVVGYFASSSSYTVYVADKDVFNHYFNIPVTDPNNILVNGNFDYIPSSIAEGTSSTNLINLPGWNVTFNTATRLYNNVDLSNNGVVQSLPYPFGTKCIRLRSAIYQSFYCVAGSYTFSAYLGAPISTVIDDYIQVNIDTTRIRATSANQGWQVITANFTIATTGMHYLFLNYSGPSVFYMGNISIKPDNTFTYLKPSKINSLILNGVFETEIKTANSRSLPPITNWTVLTADNVWILNNFSSYTAIPQPYPSGNQCIAIEALGKIRQTFTTTANSSNFLSFYACAHSETSINTLRFSINSTVIGDMNTNMFRSGTWTKVIYGGITTISGENILTIEGLTAGSISAIDNVVFGQVVKEARPITFVSPTDYQFLPLQNETMTSNTYNATQPGSLIGRYECTASSNRFLKNSNDNADVYQLFTNDPLTFYHSSDKHDGTPKYYSNNSYSNNGTYIGSNDIAGTLTYFWTTNVVNVGTISGEWVQIKLPTPIRLTRYGLLNRNMSPERFPVNYYILGSNDGSTWYSIKSVTNSQIPTWPNTQYVDVSNNTQMYMFYRIVCTKIGTTTSSSHPLNLGKFALFGDNSKTNYGTPLGSTLNAITDISGSYAYYLDPSYLDRVYPDSTLPAGNHTLYTVFNPLDTVNYSPSYGNRSFTVVLPNPQIIFPKIINVLLNDTLNYFMTATKVSPAIGGIFTFRKNNSSGSVLNENSEYDAVGDYVIYCVFVPTDTANYNTIASTYEVSVQDKEAYNNYYNIPVTDLSNILVNGNFDYNPYSLGSANVITGGIPGWKIQNGEFYKNFNISPNAMFPPPFGINVIRLPNVSAYTTFYAIQGSYTFSMTYSNTQSSGGYLTVHVDGVTILNRNLNTVNDWQTLTVNFTITSNEMHGLRIYGFTGNSAFFGNIKIVPLSVSNNISYMKFSKINSQIFNGTFETEIKTSNSRSRSPLTYWSIENPNSVWVINNFSTYSHLPQPYPSGNQCVSIEGLGKITQLFNYIDSSFNYLSFYLCAPFNGGTPNPIIVKMNNVTIATVSDTAYNHVWTKFIYTNIATVAGVNTLSIEGTDSANSGKMMLIDNVVFGSIARTPSITTYTLPANTTIPYGTPLAQLLTATCNAPVTFSYFINSTYTNQVYADSTLPVGNYQMYVKSTRIDIYNFDSDSTAGPQNFSVIMPNPQIIFPNIINVVLNETLADFMSRVTLSPANVPGTFTFRNASGSIITSDTSYNAVGPYTISCTFVPNPTGIYNTSSSTYTVNVADIDSFNNYFNIPVTDPTNLIVNGNFDYIPSSIGVGTSSTNLTNVPGWNIAFNDLTILYNNVDLSNNGVVKSLPYPFGTKCLRINSFVFQYFYCIAGTYTFSCHVAIPVATLVSSGHWVSVLIDGVQIAGINNPTQLAVGWQQFSVNFTVATTGMHFLRLYNNNSSAFYFQNISIKPVTNPIATYVRFSKINSLISNGVFETEIKTANSRSLTPITNWTVSNNAWVLNNFSSYPTIPQPYPNGKQCIAIETNGKISQTFTATASSSNFLSFYVCAISDTSINTLRCSINSTVIDINMFGSGTWRKVIYGGISTNNGLNTLTIEGITTAAGSITAIDNVIFGQVTREARSLSFVSPANYQFLPLRNETITSNTYNATQPGSLIGTYECTASSNAQNATDDIYYLFDTNPSTFYHGAYGGAGTPFYQSMPYAIDGTYIGAAITSGGSLGYFWTTNIVNVGTVSGEWIQVKLPSPIRLTRYGLAGRINWNARIPLDYYLIGSNNGSTWYSINRVTNSQLPTWPNTQYVDVGENTQLYMFYRIVCTKLGSGQMINLSQFALFGDNSKTYYGTPLGSSLNTITDISGSYAYYLDPLYNNRVYPETTLPVGNHTLYTVFTPYDTVDYLTSSTNRSLTVVLPNPQIIFPKIINVVLNETLSYFMATTTVSPAVAGTFTFRKNNSSGSVLTEASEYNAVGDYVIYCVFVPTDTANYSSVASTIELQVQDKDAYNNYYNIPVTDLTNILVNGSFTYFPSTYATKTTNATNITGWSLGSNEFFNNNNFSTTTLGITYPAPFGSSVIRIIEASIYQYFYALAGTYTASLTYINTYARQGDYIRFSINNVNAGTLTLGTTATTGQVTNWTNFSVNFTLATSGMHELQIFSTSNSAYFGNVKIVPTSPLNNVSYMKFSKIESQVFNGTFESEIRTANSRILDASLSNWNIATTGVWLLNNFTSFSSTVPIPYPSGNQCVGIEGQGKITQAFNYIDSSLNYLSFYLAATTDISRNPIVVKMNNTVIYNPSSLMFRSQTWTKQIITNIATVAGQNTLSIEGTDVNRMTMIDNVVFGSVTRSPAPTTYTLPANTILKYGLPLASLMTATSTIQTTFTYFIDSAYTNQVYPDSTLPIGNYQMYVVSTPFDTYNYLNSFASPQSFSVVSPNPTIVFPKMINVVFDETLANFINYTTVSPAIAGTFVFKLNNSSGAQLTETSKYNVVGKFTIFCTFTPANTVTYETTSATYSVTVEDNDAPNNYFNIPVTDTTNLLVNGNFEYIPSTYPPRTWTSNQPSATASNIPGWRFSTTHTSSYSAFINDLSISEPLPVISYPFPYGDKCAQLRGGQINQMVYLNAGTYTFSGYFAVSPKQDTNSYVRFWIDRVNFGNINGYDKTTGNWEYYSINFIAYASKMYQFQLASAGGPSWFIQKMSIKPTYPNPIYLKFSKIESQIFNGSFETEIKTANSKSTVPLTNWSTIRSPIWVLNSFTSYAAIPLPYPSGNQCVAIETVGKISQTFTYTASNVNYLSFYICGDASSNPITFKLNDISICTITSFSAFGGTWQKHIYTNLTTKEGINTLTIEGTNSTAGLVGIDNVILGRVNRATPTVTFPSPSPIVYGTDLSFVLVASCSTPGKFKYYIDVNYSTQVYKDTKLTPKMYSIYAIYTPTDQDNYAPAFATVDLSVNKAIPSLQYATPAPIQYGTLLESSLTATTNILGKIDYFSNPGLTTQVNSLTVLNPGTYTIYAKLTPTDLVGYTSLTTFATLVVNSTASFTPTMTYPTPTSITYGTNLANKLNASVLPNIPGSIRYYTDATFSTEVTTYTVLLPGLYTIYALFIPTNATQSSQVSKSVSLFVSNLSVETRRLVLNTRDISSSTLADNYFNTTVTTSAGTVENNRYTHTWNTNIRSIMGDEFYNRYSKFSIQLKEFVNDGLFRTTQDASQNLSVYWEVYNECKLSGIQFDPLPYENGATSNVATMGLITRKYPASNPCYHNIVNGNGSTYTFSKTTDTVPVKIDLPNLYDDGYFAPATNAILFGHMTFVFEIRGVLI